MCIIHFLYCHVGKFMLCLISVLTQHMSCTCWVLSLADLFLKLYWWGCPSFLSVLYLAKCCCKLFLYFSFAIRPLKNEYPSILKFQSKMGSSSKFWGGDLTYLLVKYSSWTGRLICYSNKANICRSTGIKRVSSTSLTMTTSLIL